MGTWWASWASNPRYGANNVVGRFDSDALPPLFFREAGPLYKSASASTDQSALGVGLRPFPHLHSDA